MNDLRVLITGATSGLGRELALQLGQRGYRVAVTGRRSDRLAETARLVEEAGGKCLALVGSASDHATVRAHYEQIKHAWGGLDWAILNAGINGSDEARNFHADNCRALFETNVFGAAEWLEVVLPDMIAAHRGVIAGIASVAAWRGLPFRGAYSASKAALATLLESLRIELRGTGVDIVTVYPGFVKSEMTARNEPGSMPFLLETSEGVARIIHGIDERQSTVHFPWPMSFPAKYVLRNIPDFLYDWVAQRFSAVIGKSLTR